MLKGHLEGILPKFIKAVLIGADLLIADIDPGVEPGKIDIDPIGVLRGLVKKAGVPDHIGIDRILKGIGITRPVKSLILMRGKNDLKIPPPLGCIDTIAGKQQKGNQEENTGADR
jgi:hypothetical protein